MTAQLDRVAELQDANASRLAAALYAFAGHEEAFAEPRARLLLMSVALGMTEAEVLDAFDKLATIGFVTKLEVPQ